jgi:hypothetical protein
VPHFQYFRASILLIAVEFCMLSAGIAHADMKCLVACPTTGALAPRLVSTQHAESGSMIKQDLAEYGLTLLTPVDPGYSDEVKKLGFERSQLEAAGLFAVILINSSNRSLAALQIHWQIGDSAGFIWNPSFGFTQPRGLLDGGMSRLDHPSFPPHSSRLVTVEGLITRPEQVQSASSRFTQGFSLVNVRIDSAVFDDGAAVGPDQDGLVSQFKAIVDARQDLIDEINSKLKQGHSLHEVLTTMPHDDEETVHSLDPDELYRRSRKNLLTELVGVERDRGEQAALQSLKFHQYANRPNIHRAVTGTAK